jgi:hypothetical protein
MEVGIQMVIKTRSNAARLSSLRSAVGIAGFDGDPCLGRSAASFQRSIAHLGGSIIERIGGEPACFSAPSDTKL